MADRWSDYVSLFVTALELDHTVYEIDRRWWEQQEVFHVLDADDARITMELVNTVASGELQPSLEGGWFEALDQCNTAGPPH